MEDKYHMMQVGDKLDNFVNTTGVVLMNLAISAAVKHDLGTMFDTPVSLIDNAVVEKAIATIRGYIRTYDELQKDYLSTVYMSFSTFNLKNGSSEVNQHVRTNGDTYNPEYDNFNDYFIDTVKNVLYMSDAQRNQVATLFVGNHYDVKLNLVKDLVSPDTLVITGHNEEYTHVPFLPSVHRIKITSYKNSEDEGICEYVNKGDDTLRLDYYIHTLTDLSTFTRVVPPYVLKMIEEGTSLKSIEICVSRMYTSNCELLVKALRTRRERNHPPIKAFRMTVLYDIETNDLSSILKEIAHLSSLEVLGLKLKAFEILYSIVHLVSKLEKLKTLILDQSIIPCNEIVKVLHGKVNNIINLHISGMSGVKTTKDTIEMVLKLENLKVLYLNAHTHGKEIEKHLLANRKKDRPLVMTRSLMDSLPANQSMIDKSTTSRILGMDRYRNPKDTKVIDFIYDTGKDDYDLDSSHPDDKMGTSHRNVQKRIDDYMEEVDTSDDDWKSDTSDEDYWKSLSDSESDDFNSDSE